MTSLLRGSSRHTIVIKRFAFSFRSGTRQDPYLVLDESDPVDFSNGLDERFTRANDVTVVFSTADRGVAWISVTSRRWTVLADSPEARNLIRAFGEQLEDRASPVILTPGFGVFLAVQILVWLSLVILLGIAFDPATRHYYVVHDPSKVPPPTNPTWMLVIAATGLALWVIGFVIGIPAIIIIRFLSGGLRIRPGSFNRIGIVEAIYKVGARIDFWASVGKILVAALGIVLAAKIISLIGH